MRVLNSKPAPAVIFDAPHRAAVVALLQSLPANVRGLTALEIREALQLDERALPDGHIQQFAVDAGFPVER